MEKKQILLKNVSNLIGKTTFENDYDHMLYSIHKMFDIIEKYSLVEFNNSIEFIEEEINLRLMRVFPPLLNNDNFFNKNSVVWSQEYKRHYTLAFKQLGNSIKLKITVDRVSKPSKENTFNKGIESKEVLKEFGLNKWNKGE